MPDCLSILIEKIEGNFLVSFIGDPSKISREEIIVLKHPIDNETAVLLETLIHFHSENDGSICYELEKIMNLILNEGIRIGRGKR